jgi:ATP-binding cassette subfamily B protein
MGQGIPATAAGARTRGDRERSHVRRLVGLLLGRRRVLLALLGASLVLNGLGLALPRCTQVILDRVVPQGDLRLLAQLVAALLALTAAQLLLTVWRRLALVGLSLALDRALLDAFAAHLLALPAQCFREYRAGDLASRFADHGQVRHLFAGGLTRAAMDALLVLVYFAVLFHYSARLALVVTAVLLAFAAFALATGPLLRRQHRQLQEDRAAQEAQLVEALTHIDLIKALALEEPIRRRWQALFERFAARNYRAQRVRQLLESSGTAVQFLSTVALVWCGAALVVGGELSTGELVAFSLYTSQAFAPLVSLITLWDEWQLARAALERVQEVLDRDPEPQPAAGRRDPGRLQGHVCFEAVCFDYGGAATPVLRGVSFAIRPGECVALVGRSGSGKTTVARLLLGLYQPSRGRVLLDGVDLLQLDVRAYRRQVGVVLQENLLLRGTIAENIALGDDQPDPERVRAAARQAGAHGLITAKPLGYEMIVGEQGLTLSAGERQRIGLARALYRDPRLLILDEVTSALDAVSEAEVQRALEAALPGRTALLIAHKLTTVRRADRVLVLQDGVIAEAGSPQELLARDGPFRRLAAQQVLGD